MDGKYNAHGRGWLSRACTLWPPSCGDEISPSIPASSTSIQISLSNLHKSMACQSKSHKSDTNLQGLYWLYSLWKDQLKLVINLVEHYDGWTEGRF